jgi:hypothetical protein
MGEVLKIESDEAVRLAAEIAQARGVPIEQAVEDALRAACAEVGRGEPARPLTGDERERAFHDLIKGSRALWKPELLSASVDDLLYDQRGLPG